MEIPYSMARRLPPCHCPEWLGNCPGRPNNILQNQENHMLVSHSANPVFARRSFIRRADNRALRVDLTKDEAFDLARDLIDGHSVV